MPDEEIILYKFQLVLDSIITIEDRFNVIKVPEDFMTTPDGGMRLDSIAIRLQLIGESIKKIKSYNKDYLTKYNEINWDEIIRFRDFISHNYEFVNPDIIYDVCKNDIPALKKTVEKILKENINK